MPEHEPTERDAQTLVEAQFGEAVHAIRRFPTGLAHWVYDIETTAGRRVVARLGRREQSPDFAGALYWNARLEPLGVPLPRVLAADAQSHGEVFPFLLLERLPGVDLGDAYALLTIPQKRELAREITAVQARVGSLPPGPGFGFAGSYDDPVLHTSWEGVLCASLERSRARIENVGAVSRDHVARVEQRLAAYRHVFGTIRPVAFLDDATTKNVLVDHGRLSGVVDVDWICFGDPLFAVALTRMSLLARGYDTAYTDFLAEEMHINDQQRAALSLYTAIFCVDFLAELGRRFNRETAPPVDRVEADRLVAILDRLLAET